MKEWKAPSVTVAAVIERGSRYLLVEELFDGKRVLNQPAGHLDPGESLIAACTREVMEETAHEFTPTALVGIYRWYYPAKDVTYLRFCFAGRLGPARERKLDQGIMALHWLTPAELAERLPEHRSPLVQKCVDDYLAGRRYPLDIFASPFL
jgi:8-oxo-dGTP pyrophosphatase MutT (NUDIX family)